MELEFKNNQTSWEAEVAVTQDFNIHLERESDGDILIMQKTSGTEFAPTTSFTDFYKTFDYDFTGYVYPKTIKIISYSPVKLGNITFNE